MNLIKKTEEPDEFVLSISHSLIDFIRIYLFLFEGGGEGGFEIAMISTYQYRGTLDASYNWSNVSSAILHLYWLAILP